MNSDERRNRISYKVNLKPYLQELNCFTLKPKSETDLISLDETKKIIERSKSIRKTERNKITIPFKEKQSEHFNNYIQRLQDANSSGIYLWIERANNCGTTLLGSLSEVNWNFEFLCNNNAILILITSDCRDEVLFDFYKEDDKELLDIETWGVNWSKISW